MFVKILYEKLCLTKSCRSQKQTQNKTKQTSTCFTSYSGTCSGNFVTKTSERNKRLFVVILLATIKTRKADANSC